MKKLSQWVLALVVIAGIASVCEAQQGRQGRQRGGRGFGGSNSVNLLTQKSVQEDLKLSEDQVSQIQQLLEKQRASFGELRNLDREERRTRLEEQTKANQTAINNILNETQRTRLEQISLQLRGPQGLASDDIAAKLQLTDAQKQEINAINEDSRREMRELFQGGRDGDREAARTKLAELREFTNEKLLAVLTDAQRAKWDELTGAPFKGEIERPNFGRGRDGAGQGGQGGRRRRGQNNNNN